MSQPVATSTGLISVLKNSREAARQLFVEDYIRTHPNAWEDWDEDMTLPKPVLMLRGASYKPSRLFGVKPHRHRGRNFIVSPGGHFAYANRILVPFQPLALLYRHYQVVFDAECVLPTLIDLRVDDHGVRFPPGMTVAERAAKGAVWMALTPGEMMSQREGIRGPRTRSSSAAWASVGSSRKWPAKMRYRKWSSSRNPKNCWIGTARQSATGIPKHP